MNIGSVNNASHLPPWLLLGSLFGNGRSNDDLECDDMQRDYSGIPGPQDKKLATSSHVVDVLPKFSRPQDRKRVTWGRNEVIPLGRILNDENSGPKHKRDKKRGTSRHVEIVLPTLPTPRDRKRMTCGRDGVVRLQKLLNDEIIGSRRKRRLRVGNRGDDEGCVYQRTFQTKNF